MFRMYIMVIYLFNILLLHLKLSSCENLGHILKINTKKNRIAVILQNIPFNMKSYIVIIITVLQNSEKLYWI